MAGEHALELAPFCWISAAKEQDVPCLFWGALLLLLLLAGLAATCAWLQFGMLKCN